LYKIGTKYGRSFHFAKEGESELSAVSGWNDILLMPLDVVKAKAQTLRKPNNKGRITRKQAINFREGRY